MRLCMEHRPIGSGLPWQQCCINIGEKHKGILRWGVHRSAHFPLISYIASGSVFLPHLNNQYGYISRSFLFTFMLFAPYFYKGI